MNIEKYENKHVMGHYKHNVYYFTRHNIVRHVESEIRKRLDRRDCSFADNYMYSCFLGYRKYYWFLPINLICCVFKSIYNDNTRNDLTALFFHTTNILKDKEKAYSFYEMSDYLLYDLGQNMNSNFKYAHLITANPEQLLNEDLKDVCSDYLMDYDYLIESIHNSIIEMDNDEKMIMAQRGEANA